MAYRELGVIELREVWRRYSVGEGVRAIARGTGVDRKTIAKYVAAAVAVGLHRGAPPPSDDQLAAFATRRRAMPVGRPGELAERLSPYQGQIQAWLTDGLRLTKIDRRLREQGVGVPYSSLHRFAQTSCGFGTPTVTVRVADPAPGEAAEVDFGLLGLWPDPAAGSRRRVYGLLVTLAFSATRSCGSPSARTSPPSSRAWRRPGVLPGHGPPSGGRHSQARRHARRSLRGRQATTHNGCQL